ncbi:MAG: hypothetical protein LBJ14_08670 [Desulfarculales bacterium]|jgi:hypothetical protein|nr:hypothetical protein [Desulfarculales bacterium]
MSEHEKIYSNSSPEDKELTLAALPSHTHPMLEIVDAMISKDKIKSSVSTAVTEQDETAFMEMVRTTLLPWQEEQILTVPAVHETQTEIMALHWHPEFVPIPLVRQRMAKMFPNAEEEICIPTQHNQLLSIDGYAGVEVDCYSSAFNLKVQLLCHFKTSRLEQAHTFKNMLGHTASYRSSQLYLLLNTLASALQKNKAHQLVQKVVRDNGFEHTEVEFTARLAAKLTALIDKYHHAIDPGCFKNKMVRDMLDAQHGLYDKILIGKAQAYAREIKREVKNIFPTGYYYKTEEIIEETRSLGGAVIIPHPEEFWPILLADYDVDGYEVWNPQSRQYTEFLISVLTRQNQRRGRRRKKILLCMGDDCHLSEKVKPISRQDPQKASREVGLQSAWNYPAVKEKLRRGKSRRGEVIAEYRARIA